MPTPTSTGVAWFDALAKEMAPPSRQNRTEEWIDYFNSLYPPGPASQYEASEADKAFRAAKKFRIQAERGVPGPLQDLDLRDAEHAMFSWSNVEGSPFWGRLATLYAVPVYSALKVAAQNYPWTLPVLSPIFDPILKERADMTMEDMKTSTPPDLGELYWGLAPIWKSRR